jgi:hypothetical protein
MTKPRTVSLFRLVDSESSRSIFATATEHGNVRACLAPIVGRETARDQGEARGEEGRVGDEEGCPASVGREVAGGQPRKVSVVHSSCGTIPGTDL